MAAALTACFSLECNFFHVLIISGWSAKCAIYTSGSAALFENNAFVWPLYTYAPLRTLPFHSGPILHYAVPFLAILLMAPLIPFTFGVELEFLFAVNTDVVAQDSTHFLSPHTGSETSPASKPSVRLLSAQGLQAALRERL
jgi:hypothetical protein